MVHLRIPWSSWLFIHSTTVYNLIRLSCVYLIFISRSISSSSSSTFNDPAVDIVKSINDYACETRVSTCLFRQRHHQSFDNNQQSSDRCKFLLILRFCLDHDLALTHDCLSSTLSYVKTRLRSETPSHCFDSPSYKIMYAQHLRSIAPSRTTVKCSTFVILLFLSLLAVIVIRTRACCWHYVCCICTCVWRHVPSLH